MGVCLLAAIHFTAFYWSTSDYTFNGDDMMYFSRSIDSVGTFLDRLLTVDQLYLYRPLTYIVFSFMLEPLFGTNPSPYHLFACLFTLFDVLLICWFVYLWTGRRLATLVPAALSFAKETFFPTARLTCFDSLRRWSGSRSWPQFGTRVGLSETSVFTRLAKCGTRNSFSADHAVDRHAQREFVATGS